MSKNRKQQLEAIHKEYEGKYQDYTYEQYMQDLLDGDIQYIDNMCAKEPLNEQQLEEMLTSTDYIAEEKYDGVRADLHFGKNIRCFSRRISKKTNWYAENTDNVPHIRDTRYPQELKGTVLDGEFRILSGDFKDISSLMNCKWDEAILRQKESGLRATFIAFDILYYKGINVMKLPLYKRKNLLAKVIRLLPSDCDIIQSSYTDDKMNIYITRELVRKLSASYPTLLKEISEIEPKPKETPFWMYASKQAWYEYILLNDGEGLMLKPKDGKYYMKRCREYTKYKKYLTKDVVISGFIDPTEEYEGKAPETWKYWGVYRQGHLEEIVEGEEPDQPTRDHEVKPVTKHFAKDWVGTIKYSVMITNEELEELKKANPKEKYECYIYNGNLYLEIGDCGGMNEEMREYMSNNRKHLIGTVIEVGCNEVIKKTGKLRHPRFLRLREDKSPDMCTFKDHLV